VSEAALHERSAAIRAATADAAAAHHGVLEAPGGDPAFRYALVFEDPARARAAGLGELDAATLFYNRYYWFRRFVAAREAALGPDAGLEQQAFKMLEAAPEDVDWSVLGMIDQRLTSGG
jgi:hypothetical protein